MITYNDKKLKINALKKEFHIFARVLTLLYLLYHHHIMSTYNEAKRKKLIQLTTLLERFTEKKKEKNWCLNHALKILTHVKCWPQMLCTPTVEYEIAPQRSECSTVA